MPDSAELLRRAAAKIRDTVTAYNPLGQHEEWYVGHDRGVWVAFDPERHSSSGLTGEMPIWAGGAADHIALWNPGIAELVAAWLEHSANEAEDPQEPPYINPRWPGFVLARAILGEPA